ncbi:MAG: hypothetical protein AAGF12_41470 [Myxococcota bacterium]
MAKKIRKILLVLGALLLGLVLIGVIAGVVISEEKPTGTPGAEAEALAVAMETAIEKEAWERTGAVRWDFGGRQQHLWDRQRNFSRVRWDETEVLLRLDDQTGRAYEGGTELTGAVAEERVAEAWSFFCNDSFWLNPIAKLRDDGVTLSHVDGERPGLLVEYASGGVTPGDAYLWHVGEDHLPTAWRMWVSIIPIGGLEASWEGWTTLSTGAKVATQHDIGPLDLVLSDVAGAATLAELEEDDPFAPLL